MSQIHAEATDVTETRPDAVYAVLRDYQVGHPAILPQPYFEECAVLEGGAGTAIRARMNVLGAKRTYLLVVSQSEPGRMLVETDADAGVVTSFKVEPISDSS